MTAPDAIVVGAGFAGLSAASVLAGAGQRVLVLDARPQLGGRATAFLDRRSGELVDNGQHVLFGCYHQTFRFLDRVGAGGNVRRQAALTVGYLDSVGRRSELRCPPLPPPLHLLAAVLDWDAIPWRERLSVLRVAAPLRRAHRELRRVGRVSVAPEESTVSDWLREHGQGARLCAWLWEPLAVAALNQPPETASASAFVRVLAEMFGPDPAAAALALPTRPLHLMYAEPARAYIEARGGSVRANALARLWFDGGTLAGAEVRGERIPCRRVISAVPWFGLRALFAGEPPSLMREILEAADAMASMPIVTVNLWYDRKVMDEPFVGLPGRAMQWVFDKRMAFGRQSSHLSLVASGAETLVKQDANQLIARAAREIADALPTAATARLVAGTVIREKRATFSLSNGQPPRPGVTTPIEGLYLAGDWIDTGLPGTIESAVVSGHLAARAVLNRMR